MKDLAVGAVQILYVAVIPTGPFADEALDSDEFAAGESIQFMDDRVTKCTLKQGKHQSLSSQSRPD
jgi:hypothetical protein